MLDENIAHSSEFSEGGGRAGQEAQRCHNPSQLPLQDEDRQQLRAQGAAAEHTSPAGRARKVLGQLNPMVLIMAKRAQTTQQHSAAWAWKGTNSPVHTGEAQPTSAGETHTACETQAAESSLPLLHAGLVPTFQVG